MEEIAKNTRNYGIDLLRFIAMFFVIILHSYLQGGILTNVITDSLQYKVAWFIEICAYCAVNIFAIISGYVNYTEEKKQVNYSNYLNLWFEVVFFGLLICLIYKIFWPNLVTKRVLVLSLMPISNKYYWYFTAYTGLFLIMPILNNGIRNISKENLKKILILFFAFFSIFDMFTNVFYLINGYSFVWLTILYIIGAIIKKCDIGKNAKKSHLVIGIILLIIITFFFKNSNIYFHRLNVYFDNNSLVSYISPTILGISILYVLLFSKFKFCNKKAKLIKFLASSSFSIYIINNHELFYQFTLYNLFAKIANASVLKVILIPFLFSMIFSISAVLIDKIRILIFKWIRVEKISKFIISVFDKIISYISLLY